jgi:hypothetical protein
MYFLVYFSPHFLRTEYLVQLAFDSPPPINQTVFVAKDFLDAELAKYDSSATSGENTKDLFDTERAFQTAKGMRAA